MDKIIGRMIECVDKLNRFLDEEHKKQYINEIIEGVNKHNDKCSIVFNRFIDETDPSTIQCLMTMMQGNLDISIKWCCIMRQQGLDALVDCVSGVVVQRSAISGIVDEMICGKRRFNTFEYAAN